MHIPGQLRVISLGGDRGRGPVYVRNTSDRIGILCTQRVARASTVGGTSRPSALAVLRLIASSYFTGACTGRSAPFVNSAKKSSLGSPLSQNQDQSATISWWSVGAWANFLAKNACAFRSIRSSFDF